MGLPTGDGALAVPWASCPYSSVTSVIALGMERSCFDKRRPCDVSESLRQRPRAPQSP